MSMYVTSPETEPDKLDERRVYRFKARNFFLGVWNGRRDDLCGFIGVRTKFDSVYLFTEYHCTTGGSVGTVHQIEATEHYVPDDIEIRENFDTCCRVCKGAIKWVPDQPEKETPGRWFHEDPEVQVDHDAHGNAFSPMNVALLDFLKPLVEEQQKEFRIEDEKRALAAESRKWRPQTQAEYCREVAVASVKRWRDQEIAAVSKDDREAHERISDEFMERFREACAANPLPEETW